VRFLVNMFNDKQWPLEHTRRLPKSLILIPILLQFKDYANVCSRFCEFRLIYCQQGTFVYLVLYQRASFGHSSVFHLFTCSSQSCLCRLVLSCIKHAPNSFLLSSFLISSSEVSYSRSVLHEAFCHLNG
jgi:hypothetical protein